MQVGSKNIEVGLPLYDICRKHGAMIHTGHEHSYSRTHIMTSFVDLTFDNTSASNITLKQDQTIAWVSGIAGVGLRPFVGGLQNNPWWASRWATDNGVNYGALICRFNYNGDLRKAYCEMKDISNRIMDSFTMTSELPEIPSSGQVCQPKPDVEVQVSTTNDDAVEYVSTGNVDCTFPKIEMSSATIAAFRYALLIGYYMPLLPSLTLLSSFFSRFVNVPVDQGAQVLDAFIEWASDTDQIAAFSVNITGEKTIDSPAFTCTSNSLSSRPKTGSFVVWNGSPEAWYEGGLYKSINIAPIIQEIVNQPGWVANNSITIFVQGISGAKREAESYAGDRCSAATLTLTLVGTTPGEDCILLNAPIAPVEPPPQTPPSPPPSSSSGTPQVGTPFLLTQPSAETPSNPAPTVSPPSGSSTESPYTPPSEAPTQGIQPPTPSPFTPSPTESSPNARSSGMGKRSLLSTALVCWPGLLLFLTGFAILQQIVM
jgi:hypothetical protein